MSSINSCTYEKQSHHPNLTGADFNDDQFLSTYTGTDCLSNAYVNGHPDPQSNGDLVPTDRNEHTQTY